MDGKGPRQKKEFAVAYWPAGGFRGDAPAAEAIEAIGHSLR